MLNCSGMVHAKLFWYVRRKKFFSRYILSGFHCILLSALCLITLKINTSRKTEVGNKSWVYKFSKKPGASYKYVVSEGWKEENSML